MVFHLLTVLGAYSRSADDFHSHPKEYTFGLVSPTDWNDLENGSNSNVIKSGMNSQFLKVYLSDVFRYA